MSQAILHSLIGARTKYHARLRGVQIANRIVQAVAAGESAKSTMERNPRKIGDDPQHGLM